MPLYRPVLCFFFAGVAAAQVTPPGLTLDAALHAAQARSMALQAQDAASHAARAMAVSAGRLPDPVLTLSVDKLSIQGPMRWSLREDAMSQRSVGWMQTYTGPEKRSARSARYEREAETSAALRALQKSRLLAQTAMAWLDRYFQEQQLGLLQGQRQAYQRISDAMESAYRGGRSNQEDVLDARAAVARIDDRLQEARADLANAQALLQRWVGDAAAQALGSLPRIAHTRLTSQALTQQVGRHPEMAVLDARERAALAETDLAKHDRKADWSWSLMYSNRVGSDADMVSLGVSIPLQWDRANKQDRELSARLQELEQVRLEREELRRERLFQLQRLLSNWQAGLARLAAYDATLIPLAIDRVAVMETAFRSAKAPLAAVLDAHGRVIDTQLEQLRLQRQTAAWWAELEFQIPQESMP